ncbi:MAG: heavy-metal-associated protein [Segetibacter sp.]|nr:heavy-metal-associated protein [Segetibacter sp.]
MKKLFVIIASLLVIQAQAQYKQAKLQASGLTCSMCSNAIYKSLKKLPFAGKISTNIKESTFTIDFKDGHNVSFDAMKKAVEDAGFSVSNLNVTAKFDNVNVSHDAHIALGGQSLHFLNIKNQILTGDKTFQVVDKKFVNDKVYKKYAAATKMECVKTGVMQSCCTKNASTGSNRIYHVTI